MERFRDEMERQDNVHFARALHRCTLNISGGDANCPLGRLVREESSRKGRSSASGLLAQPLRVRDLVLGRDQVSSPAVCGSVSQAMEWRGKYNKLWTLLTEDARLSGDEDCLQALEACNDLVPMHRCPVRELIVQGLWHGRNS
jgi:hypothetical protein